MSKIAAAWLSQNIHIMSHYFTIPITTEGIIADLQVSQNFKAAVNAPFNVSDVFIYSHGWWTSATSALSGYNEFSVELSLRAGQLGAAADPAVPNLPESPLGVAIHWPSMIDDDGQAIINNLEPLSFYTMGHRANQVGTNAVYSLLRLLIEQSPAMPRIHFLGHSFGCRVVSSAVQEILNDSVTIPNAKNLAINMVLLEAAFDQNDLEATGLYGGICSMPNVRILTSYSSRDASLSTYYPLSQELNIFKGSGAANQALGGAGPTPKMIADFGGVTPLTINPGFSHTAAAAARTRLVSADLTPVHTANTAYGNVDHHSDIYLPEIYNLICGFLFQ
jgi:hypothetical protein